MKAEIGPVVLKSADTFNLVICPSAPGAQKKRCGYWMVKGIFDFCFALVALIVLFIPMAMIAVAIRLDSPGRAIYKQERLGKNGKPFTIYKFRSMFLDAEKDGAQWAKKHDARCTRVGCFIRRYRLDELPQLWNILRGDMSFVGPRPERACFYLSFEENVPGFSHRLAVLPGLTGYAQVNGGYDLAPAEKLKYDMEYISKPSFAMDLHCMIKTIRIVFTHEGAY